MKVVEGIVINDDEESFHGDDNEATVALSSPNDLRTKEMNMWATCLCQMLGPVM